MDGKMSIEVIKGEHYSVLICNTTMAAFGSVFYEDEDAEAFLNWLPVDARTLTESEFDSKQGEWRLLPKCGYCEKRTDDELESLRIGSNHYDCCNECFELFVDDDAERQQEKADMQRKAMRGG